MGFNTKVLLGKTLSFSNNPFTNDLRELCCYRDSGAVIIKDGVIQNVLDASELSVSNEAEIIDYKDCLILAGFVDAHLHYPQTAVINSWGKRLIDWLNYYTFPEEKKFSDLEYAKKVSSTYFDIALSNGITTSVSYGTVHPESVDAFFSEAKKRGLRALAGKTCMDRNAPDFLCDTPQKAYDDSRALIEKWHETDRLEYVITPRFSPTSSADQLHMLGGLWSEYPTCLMQTHISEQPEEIEWVKKLFPKSKDYLDTYDAAGLLGERSVFGHGIYLNEREKDLIKEVGASIIHCPTSNTFIGSGLFDLFALSKADHKIGLATDIGGGSSFSMLKVMASTYEIGQLLGNAIHPAELLWLSTVGSAKALHLNSKIGNLEKGMEADITVLDLHSTSAISQRALQANNIWELIFPTIMMGDDRAIKDVFIRGKKWASQLTN